MHQKTIEWLEKEIASKKETKEKAYPEEVEALTDIIQELEKTLDYLKERETDTTSNNMPVSCGRCNSRKWFLLANRGQEHIGNMKVVCSGCGRTLTAERFADWEKRRVDESYWTMSVR